MIEGKGEPWYPKGYDIKFTSEGRSVDSSINHVNGAMNEYKFYVTDTSLDGKLLKFELTPK
jgi:hypothetical protein